ncbi:TPA: hypothetical protein N0F65_008302 [Lagenidium giganteum]|uniref:C3H1-type domain-containing protein n=1 Tax=Lagenidium giganteum TaxID=4803 RepID=A0AAV2YUJ5_9STRA|nr:TPA: hypothetical protein N0F65_008302 [Lagenidium giganteum]
MRTLRALREEYDRMQDAAVGTDVESRPRHRVYGQFVRKRNLSKGLIFGDIKLEDNDLVEVMIRAADGALTINEIKQLNWHMHLGDMVTAEGWLKLAETGALLFVLTAVRIEHAWSELHPGEYFDHSQYSTILTKHRSGDVANHGNGGSSETVSRTLAPASQTKTATKYTNMVMIDGMNACKYYFASAARPNCFRGAQCHFWHGAPEDFAANRQRWLAQRLAQRQQVSAIDGDEQDPHSKMMKAQRARLFCDWLVELLGEECMQAGTGVVDVAGGKGEIAVQLWNRRGIPTTLIDPRPMKMTKKNRRLVAKSTAQNERGPCPQIVGLLDDATLETHRELFENCALLVGMHPDEATELIVDTALRLRKPFAVVPCCVMSRLFPDRRCADGTEVATYETFVTYLSEKDPRIQRAFLPFSGRNQVLYLIDY